MPIFILLLMGTIDFANAFNDYNSVRQGVREGARQGVVARWSADGCTGSSSSQLSCVTKQRIGLDATRTRVKIDVPVEYEPGEELTVCAMYQAHSITGMFNGIFEGRALTTAITMRIECQRSVGRARWRTADLPGRGQQNCPVVARGSARSFIWPGASPPCRRWLG